MGRKKKEEMMICKHCGKEIAKYEGTNKEVYINNSSDFYTGRSGGSYSGNTAVNSVYLDQTNVTVQYSISGFYTYDGYLLEYNTNNKTNKRDVNKVASTTGNIYGIYDMSGGTWEYVMGVFANSDGEKWSHGSGFVGKSGANGTEVEGLSWPNEKYYEIYKANSGTSISLTTACNGKICYGHALSETWGWYSDYMSFAVLHAPRFIRGGRYSLGTSAGVFGSNSVHGNADVLSSARVVLTQTT